MKKLLFPALLFLAFLPLAFAGDDFKPISQEELAMKDNPAAPGEHAMILEWTDIEDDNAAYEDNYFRIKIFTEEGKKHADIEIPFTKDFYNIGNIKGRTIHPDGSIVPFTGKIYDKLVVKARGVKVLAKTFSLPDVQPGSIIEYRYRRTWPEEYVVDSTWVVQQDLFIKRAYFKLTPSSNTYLGSAWQAFRLPQGAEVKKGKNNAIELEIANMPAFEHERFAPPEKELKPRVNFWYRSDDSRTVDEFWKGVAKKSYQDTEDYIGKRRGIAQAVESLISPQDAAETKLRKLYTKVQSLRNLSYEREKTEQEIKRDNKKINNNVEDVLKRGYGWVDELDGLFVAMARAAGFESYIVRVSERDDTFFNKTVVNARQLDGYVAYVKADGKEYWLDPGTPFCPFGLLPWRKTGVMGLMLNSKNDANFVTTPNPESKDAITRRIANLKFEDGLFKGEVGIVFTGQEALFRRVDALQEDEQSVKEDIENELKGMLPGGTTLKLKKFEGLKANDGMLYAIYDAEVPNPPASAGSRMMLNTSIFEHADSPFQHENRKQAVYFSYPYQVIDSVTLNMPKELEVEALPDHRHEQSQAGYFDCAWSKDGGRVEMKRGFAVLGMLYPLSEYQNLRNFYAKVASGDQEAVVLRAAKQ